MPDDPLAQTPTPNPASRAASPVVPEAKLQAANVNLLKTKLYRPSTYSKRVQRPHLVRRLNEGLGAGRPITLVSAPAGFGKTTCICDWVNTLALPVTWLSLEPADDDPERFFTYFIAALQRVDENLGREIEGMLRAGQLPPGDIISTTLSNDILDVEAPFLLILDDFQVIQDTFILRVLEQLVFNPPPPLHLILLTREDPSLPLARLRANNQLTEIRAGDLRFTPEEADRFLKEVMGLSLPATDIAALEDRTEGWIVGLQLAGFSVRDRTNPSSFIAALSGSRRHILSYLTEEVLSRQPEEIQSFLLQTSILERLSGDVCNAVTGRSDAHALLERIYNDNLFLIPLDDEQHWYRYHHLFADLLRDLEHKLGKDQTAELHRRASRWYAEAGLAGEAIQHALAAADYALVVRLVEDHAMEMLVQGYAKTVEDWLKAIPPELRSQNLRANLAFAWMHLLRGAFAQVFPYVERLQAAMFSDSLTSVADPSLKAEWLALQSMLLNGQGKPKESLELARQALNIVPEADGYVRSLIYMGEAAAYQLLDDYARSVEAFQMLILHGRAAGSFVSEMLGIAGLVQSALFHGQLQFAFALASQGVDRVERSGSLPPISAAVYGALGQVYYQRHRIEQAHSYFLRASQLSTLSGYSDAEIGRDLLVARLLQMGGDLEGAAQAIQKAVDLMQAVAPAWVREEVVAHQVRLYLAQGRVAAAELALKGQGFASQDKFSIPDLAPGQKINSPVGTLYNSALRILLYRAQANRDLASLGQGIELADCLIAAALQAQYLPVALETLLLRAQMHTALGNSQAGLADVGRALELAEPEGYVTLFVQEGVPIAEAMTTLHEHDRLGTVQPAYVKSILDVFSEYRLPGAVGGEVPPPRRPAAPAGPAALFELLTERELNVLRLMAEGMKYEEIAQKLYISLNTVRSHAKTIYGKLSVNNRTKAIETARQLHIL